MSNELATKYQIKYMRELKISFDGDTTKTEATKLISTKLKPDEDQIIILKRFGMKAVNQWDARVKIKELFADPENKKKWENRPASKEDKSLIDHILMNPMTCGFDGINP